MINGDQGNTSEAARPHTIQPRPARRQRRAANGRRTRIVGVRLSELEYAYAERRAAGLGITVSRLMAESVIAEEPMTRTERHALYGELADLRRFTLALLKELDAVAKTREVDVAATAAGIEKLIEQQTAVLLGLRRIPHR
jgi:hypothetical protein